MNEKVTVLTITSDDGENAFTRLDGMFVRYFGTLDVDDMGISFVGVSKNKFTKAELKKAVKAEIEDLELYALSGLDEKAIKDFLSSN